MESENNNIVPEIGNEEMKKRKGLKISGYVIPWWIVILILLVALYYSYEQGYLNAILGESLKQSQEFKGSISIPTIESAAKPSASVRALFNTHMY